MLERHAVLQSRSRIEELVKIFIHATKVREVFRKREVNADSVLPRWKQGFGIWEQAINDTRIFLAYLWVLQNVMSETIAANPFLD